MRTNEAWFPIQADVIDATHGRESGRVPWGIAALAYDHYRRLYGQCQTLERLAERGGFSWSELATLLSGSDSTSHVVPFAEPRK